MRWPAEVSLAQFGACFSECCILFILVVCQSANIFDPATRRLHWRISLAVVAFQLIAAFPLLQCLLVTSRTHRSGMCATATSSGMAYIILHSFVKSLVDSLAVPGIFVPCLTGVAAGHSSSTRCA